MQGAQEDGRRGCKGPVPPGTGALHRRLTAAWAGCGDRSSAVAQRISLRIMPSEQAILV